MSSVERRNVAVKIGGSVLIKKDHEIDTDLFLDFVDIFPLINQAAIVTGGGKPSRRNIQALMAVGEKDPKKLDRSAMGPTREHARLFADMLLAQKIPAIHVHDIHKPLPQNVRAGTSGGDVIKQSTDTVLLKWAYALGFTNFIIKITNVPCMYELYPDGSLNMDLPIESISWKQVGKMLGTDFWSGMHKIIDPKAVKFGQKHELTLHIMATDMENVQRLLRKEQYFGTTIHP